MIKNNRIEKIEKQIDYLSARKRKLEDKRGDKLIKILNRCGANKLPAEILAGVIAEAIKAVNDQDKRVSQWALEGAKILKPGRGRRKALVL